MKKKIKQEKFILYDEQNFSDRHSLSEKQKHELYDKIDKRQRRNAKIIAISVFLYIFTVAWFLFSVDYFEDIEQETIWLLSTTIFLIIATFLLIFALVTKSKDGKIKYQYKNAKYFYVSTVFGIIGIFILFGGLSSFLDLYTSLFISFIFLGACASFGIYHDLTKGKKPLSRWIKLTITIVLGTIAGVLGYFLNNDKDFTFTEDYSKTAMVIYDKNDQIKAITKSKNVWYAFIEEKNSNKNEFSVSKEPANMEYVYETENTEVYNLSANDNYAVWTEISKGEISYNYYDRYENQVYELIAMPFDEKSPQNYNIGLYNDKIYYEIIDYKENLIDVIEYDISENKDKVIFTINANAQKLGYQSLNVNDNNLLLTTYVNNGFNLIHADLNQIAKENYKPKVIEFSKNYYDIYSVSYDNKNEKYAIYYNEQNVKKISIFNKDGKIIKNVAVLSQKDYAFENKLSLKNNKLYWINMSDSKKISADDYKLKIYDCKKNKTQTVNNVLRYTLDGSTIYGLGFYRNNLNSPRLYEIWN